MGGRYFSNFLVRSAFVYTCARARCACAGMYAPADKFRKLDLPSSLYSIELVSTALTVPCSFYRKFRIQISPDSRFPRMEKGYDISVCIPTSSPTEVLDGDFYYSMFKKAYC